MCAFVDGHYDFGGVNHSPLFLFLPPTPTSAILLMASCFSGRNMLRSLWCFFEGVVFYF